MSFIFLKLLFLANACIAAEPVQTSGKTIFQYFVGSKPSLFRGTVLFDADNTNTAQIHLTLDLSEKELMRSFINEFVNWEVGSPVSTVARVLKRSYSDKSPNFNFVFSSAQLAATKHTVTKIRKHPRNWFLKTKFPWHSKESFYTRVFFEKSNTSPELYLFLDLFSKQHIVRLFVSSGAYVNAYDGNDASFEFFQNQESVHPDSLSQKLFQITPGKKFVIRYEDSDTVKTYILPVWIRKPDAVHSAISFAKEVSDSEPIYFIDNRSLCLTTEKGFEEAVSHYEAHTQRDRDHLAAHFKNLKTPSPVGNDGASDQSACQQFFYDDIFPPTPN